jgi:O-antigen ligase
VVAVAVVVAAAAVHQRMRSFSAHWAVHAVGRVAVVAAAAAVVVAAAGQAEQVDMEEAALSGYSS